MLRYAMLFCLLISAAESMPLRCRYAIAVDDALFLLMLLYLMRHAMPCRDAIRAGADVCRASFDFRRF